MKFVKIIQAKTNPNKKRQDTRGFRFKFREFQENG